jgi:large subunit ribosomal protein L29
MVQVKELRGQTREELKDLQLDLSKEIFQLRNEMKVSRQVKSPHRIRMKRKDRARVLTILREKEIKATS